MPTPSDPQLPTRNHAPVCDETTLRGLTVEGTLPTALTGRYLQIGLDGMIHAVELDAARAVGYFNRWLASDDIATNVMSFGGRTLALGPGVLAYELDEHLGTLGRVDLAGHGRGMGAHPQLDPHTGALHLVSYGDEPAHHIVAPNSQTRITVPVPDAPGPLQDLLLPPSASFSSAKGSSASLIAPASAGPVGRRRSPRCRRGLGPRRRVVILAASRSLVRWTFRAGSPRRDVLDDTAQRFGTTNRRVPDPTHVWTAAAAGGTEVYRHDLHTGDRTAHDLGTGRHPGAMTFVPDPTRLQRETAAGSSASPTKRPQRGRPDRPRRRRHRPTAGRDRPDPSAHPLRAPRHVDPERLSSSTHQPTSGSGEPVRATRRRRLPVPCCGCSASGG